MAGFLEEYGVTDARREKRWKLVAISVAGVLAVAFVLYFLLRSNRAEHQVELFLQHLRNKDYQQAYRLWGCTESSPCREYTLDRFLEDWGPKSSHADASAARIKKLGYCGPGAFFKLETFIAHRFGELGCYCDTGTILAIDFGKSDEVPLWVDRRENYIGFAPWPVCLPEPKAFQ